MSLTLSPAEIVARAEATGTPGLLAIAPEWSRVRLGDVAAVVSGAAYPSSGFNTEQRGMPLIRIRDVGADRTATWFEGAWERKHVVRQRDILIGMDGDFRVAEWRGEDALLNQRVCRVDVDPEQYEPRFLLHAIQGYLDAIWAATSSVTVKHLSSRSIADIPLPNPPIEEQRRIVAVLEDHLSRLDAAVSSIELNLTRLDRLRQSVVDDAFARMRDPKARVFCDGLLESRGPSQGRGRVPARADIELLGDELPWPVASLEQVTDAERVIRYGILKPASEPGDVPYVEVRNLRTGELASPNLKCTSETLDQQFAGARLRAGDVVVAVRGSFERSAVVPAELEGSNISRDVVRLAPLPGMRAAYLRHWYETSTNKRYLRRHARGVAVRGVNVGTLRALPVPVVSPEVQEKVVTQISEGLASADRLRASLEVSRRRAAGLKRALLAAAFAGRLTKAPAEWSEYEEAVLA